MLLIKKTLPKTSFYFYFQKFAFCIKFLFLTLIKSIYSFMCTYSLVELTIFLCSDKEIYSKTPKLSRARIEATLLIYNRYLFFSYFKMYLLSFSVYLKRLNSV